MAFAEIPFHRNALLFGHDTTPGLIAFEPEGDDRVRVFARKDGETTSDLRPFTPFLLLATTDLLAGYGGGVEFQELAGDAFFKYLALFPSWPDLLKARDHLQKATGKTATAPDAPYLFLGDPVHQYLIATGQTHFLGLPFSALRRLQLDIETYCGEGFEFPNANREGDRITAIALCDSSGWERLISGKDLSEAEMLKELTREVRDRDPDVIEGHNLFRFDLEYIEARAKRHRVTLAWGRDGGLLKSHPSRMQIAERAITYRKYEVFGRHIVDTWILAQHYDVSARELGGFGLKEVARHFGLAVGDRTYIPPDRVSWYFDHEPETLFRYALDDVREARALSELLSQSYFVQAQIFPFSYQNVVLKGNATKIDSLLVREYLRQRRSIPAPAVGQEVAGGYTDIRFQGVARHVLHCDITSLYPSIMLTYRLFPRSDELGIFPALLQDLKDFRVQAKGLARRASHPEERAYHDALQATFKVLINSFYGYLGFAMAHFNDFEVANRVTATGRDLIREIMGWLEARGCRIIEIDTDGLYFVPPDGIRDEDQESAFMEALIRSLPQGIHLELDGRYRAMFSYKMKNYALLDYDGKVTITGSGLRSRGLELFQRKWMEEMFVHLLKDQPEKIEELTQRYLQAFDRHEFDVEMFMKTETLQDSLDTYREKVKAKKRNPAAPYELALKSERRYEPGDQVSYYVTGTSPKVKVNESCKLASQWDKDSPDENVAYYKAKLLELYAKFKPFVEAKPL